MKASFVQTEMILWPYDSQMSCTAMQWQQCVCARCWLLQY